MGGVGLPFLYVISTVVKQSENLNKKYLIMLNFGKKLC